MTNMQKLKIADLDRKNLQTRAALDEETVADYAESMAKGDRFPPVTVYHDGETYYLADGFHRVEAAARNGLKVIAAEVREGEYKDALLFALKANTTHGLRRTNADKRHALEMAWNARESLFGGEPSNALLADCCGVTRLTVQNWKASTGCINYTPCTGAQGGTMSQPAAPVRRPVPTRNVAPKTAENVPKRENNAPSRVVPRPLPAPVRRVGRDGKTYTVPVRPSAPTRSPAYDHAKGVMTDCFGVEIPMQLRGAFKAETVRDEIETHLRAAANLLKRATDEKDPSVAQFRQADLIDLQNAVRTAKFTKPYCVCRICQGNGRGSCTACHETGFQTKAQYDNNPKEFKA